MNDPSKDVLVLLHSDYVGPRDEIEDLFDFWKSLAKEVENIEDLIVARYNLHANEVLGLNINSFPNARFYPKNDKKGMFYNWDRTLEHFREFLAEFSTAY